MIDAITLTGAQACFMLPGVELFCLFKQITFDSLIFFVLVTFGIVWIETSQNYLSLHLPLDTIEGMILNSSI